MTGSGTKFKEIPHSHTPERMCWISHTFSVRKVTLEK